jgi:hypothetical protein
LVYGKTREEHDANLNHVLKKLENYGLTANREKCIFNQKELTFFGLNFSTPGIALTEEKVKAIKDARSPQTVVKNFIYNYLV